MMFCKVGNPIYHVMKNKLAKLIVVAWKYTGLNIKNVFPRYGDSHVQDKTVVRLSYL